MESLLSGVDAARIRALLSPRGTAPAPKLGERYAAVAIVLRDGPAGIESLLIRRAQLEGDPWSGHMAFPGGRHDATDPDLLFTAIRETREEVGLDLEKSAAYLGRLELLPAIAKGKLVGLSIAPFVFQLMEPVDLTPNREVMETLWAPLSDLSNGAHATIVRFTMKEQELELPGWDIDGRVVWGLTYRMLQALLEDLTPAT